jgi:hypothetical protein
VGVPFDLPVNLCDCRTLWMLDTAVAEDKLARLAALFDAACPDWREPIHLSVELDSADIRKAYEGKRFVDESNTGQGIHQPTEPD